MKKIVSMILVVAMLASFGAALAIEAGEARVVIGANITAEQRTSVYQTFGIASGEVEELTVTNAEERAYLEGLVEPQIIGTNSISCVYIETLNAGDGLQVEVSNVNWVTREMYINALVTAGITDAKVNVTSPVTVSGTAALTGIYKAYEDITGEKLSEEAKLAGTQELVVTAELADQIGSYDAVVIVNELKKILSETVNMSDDEVKAEIERIASENGISVSEMIVNQLLKLCRSLEGLDDAELQKRVEEAQKTIQSLAKAQSTVASIGTAVKDFFASIGNFFSKLFGGKKD